MRIIFPATNLTSKRVTRRANAELSDRRENNP